MTPSEVTGHPGPCRAPLRSLRIDDQLIAAGSLAPQGWRLLSGAMRIDLVEGHDRQRFVQVALAGDVLGLEALCGQPSLYQVRAITPCTLQPLVPLDAGDERQLMAEALGQQWARAADMTSLRTGAVPERLKRLLLMLSCETGASLRHRSSRHLPRIKDIAVIIDTAPETVSRILSSLRRLQLLDERHPGHARYDAVRLAASALPTGMTSSIAAPH